MCAMNAFNSSRHTCISVENSDFRGGSYLVTLLVLEDEDFRVLPMSMSHESHSFGSELRNIHLLGKEFDVR